MAEYPHKGHGFRKIYCNRYENCLDLAVKEDWEGFNCEECSHEGTVQANDDYIYQPISILENSEPKTMDNTIEENKTPDINQHTGITIDFNAHASYLLVFDKLMKLAKKRGRTLESMVMFVLINYLNRRDKKFCTIAKALADVINNNNE